MQRTLSFPLIKLCKDKCVKLLLHNRCSLGKITGIKVEYYISVLVLVSKNVGSVSSEGKEEWQ